ncbi:MAG: alpha/beta hydrolase [Xanthobacteraceae bacterium]|nr:alpha/beta hydrolase [Xanthobacteraceae bacterium]
MPDMTSRYANADGIRTHYFEEGRGPALILLHGGGAGADSYGNWRATLPLFAAHFRTIAVDMVGFGKTDKPDPATFEFSQAARVAHLRAFMKALEIPSAILVGNSMGGATALGLASQSPELVTQLILMGSAGLNTRIHDDLLPVINYDFSREGMLRLIRALVNENFVVDEALIDYRHSNSIEPDTRRAYAATMKWIRDQGGLFYEPEVIRRVACPTLIVSGKNDKVVPLENAYRFLELIDRSWGYIIPHCGHWAMLEHPDDFARASVNFLQTTGASATSPGRGSVGA